MKLDEAASVEREKGRWFNSKLRLHVYELREAPVGSNEFYEYRCLGATTGDDRPGVFIPDGALWAVYPIPDFDDAVAALLAYAAKHRDLLFEPEDKNAVEFIPIDALNSYLSQNYLRRLLEEIKSARIPGLLLSEGQVDNNNIGLLAEAKTLRLLRIDNCAVDAGFLERLAEDSSIESLDIEFDEESCRAVGGETLRAISGFSNLEVLRLSVDLYAHDQPRGETSLEELKSLAKLTRLRTVLIRDSTDRTGLLSANVFGAFASLPNLQRLRLWGWGTSSKGFAMGMKALARNGSIRELGLRVAALDDDALESLPALTKLRSFDAMYFGDAAKIRLPPNVTQVRLYGFLGPNGVSASEGSRKDVLTLPDSTERVFVNNGVVPANFIEYLAKLPRLREVEMRYFSQHTDGAERMRAMKTLRRVTTLHVECGGDVQLHDVSPWESFPQMSNLDLSDVLLDDDDLKSLSAMSDLSSLRLMRCHGFSEKGLGQLASLKKLKKLEIIHSALWARRSKEEGTGDDGIAALLAELHALQVLDLRESPLGSQSVSSLMALSDLRDLNVLSSGLAVEDLRRLSGIPLSRLIFTWKAGDRQLAEILREARGKQVIVSTKLLYKPKSPIAQPARAMMMGATQLWPGDGAIQPLAFRAPWPNTACYGLHHPVRRSWWDTAPITMPDLAPPALDAWP